MLQGFLRHFGHAQESFGPAAKCHFVEHRFRDCYYFAAGCLQSILQ